MEHTSHSRSVSKDILIVLTCGLVALAFFATFRRLFDTSSMEQSARALIGKHRNEIAVTLGKPNKVLEASEFNSRERENMRASFMPKDLPAADGPVHVYNWMPTLVLVFESKGKVREVYIGRT